jgi:hypothetical protein
MRGKMPIVRKHGEWVSLLGGAFFAVYEDASPIVALEHECPPVFVAIKHNATPKGVVRSTQVAGKPKHRKVDRAELIDLVSESHSPYQSFIPDHIALCIIFLLALLCGTADSFLS